MLSAITVTVIATVVMQPGLGPMGMDLLRVTSEHVDRKTRNISPNFGDRSYLVQCTAIGPSVYRGAHHLAELSMHPG